MFDHKHVAVMKSMIRPLRLAESTKEMPMVSGEIQIWKLMDSGGHCIKSSSPICERGIARKAKRKHDGVVARTKSCQGGEISPQEANKGKTEKGNYWAFREFRSPSTHLNLSTFIPDHNRSSAY
ncbi:hypothetical protein AN958_01616 [Leucoagaricus sp. SymC.cos]|nr:hypothetical protein AN958_01616 [Leucoagaricus sp. SymC.cos]